MKKLLFALTLVVMLTSCNPLAKIEKAGYPINYTELQNYYVLNNIDASKIQRLVINSQAAFESYFGEAAVMGRNGQPTKVDFKTQYVLAVVLPETDRQTEVVPGEVVQNGNTVIMNYRVNKGPKTSYRMVPFAAIAIDKPVSDTQMEIYFKQTN